MRASLRRCGAAVVDPGAVARNEWGLKVPLVDQWQREVSPHTETLFPDRRVKLLAYWLEQSETDEWTFDQLGELVGALMDAGEAVPALDQWAREVAARRRTRPKRRGPKGDRTRDFTVAALVHTLSRAGMSGRTAKRLLANTLHQSEEAIESARARGRRV